MDDRLREALASIEHDQWMAWSQNLAGSEELSGDRVERWQSMWVPYADLTEEIKDYDREWADKVLAALAASDPAPTPSEPDGAQGEGPRHLAITADVVSHLHAHLPMFITNLVWHCSCGAEGEDRLAHGANGWRQHIGLPIGFVPDGTWDLTAQRWLPERRPSSQMNSAADMQAVADTLGD